MHCRIIADLQRGVYYQKCHDPVCKSVNYKSQGIDTLSYIVTILFFLIEYPIPTDVNPSCNQPATAPRINDDSWLVDVSLEDLEDYSLESNDDYVGDGGDGGSGGGGGDGGGGGGGSGGGGDGGSGGGGGGSGSGGGGGGGSGGGGGGSGSGGGGGSGSGGGGGGGSGGGGGGGGSGSGGDGGEDDDSCGSGGGGLDDEAILDRVANEMDFNFSDEASAVHHPACAVMRFTESTVKSSS